MADMSDDFGQAMPRHINEAVRAFLMLFQMLHREDAQKIADKLDLLNAWQTIKGKKDMYRAVIVKGDGVPWIDARRKGPGATGLVQRPNAKGLRLELKMAGLHPKMMKDAVYILESELERAKPVIDDFMARTGAQVSGLSERSAYGREYGTRRPASRGGDAREAQPAPDQFARMRIGDPEVARQVADKCEEVGIEAEASPDGDVVFHKHAEPTPEQLKDDMMRQNILESELDRRSKSTFTHAVGDREVAERIVSDLGEAKGAELSVTDRGDISYKLAADAIGVGDSVSKVSLVRDLATGELAARAALGRERAHDRDEHGKDGHDREAREESPDAPEAGREEAGSAREGDAPAAVGEANRTARLDPGMRQLLSARERGAAAPGEPERAPQAHTQAVDADLTHPADFAIGDTVAQAEAKAPLDPSRDGGRQTIPGQDDLDGDGLPRAADDLDGNGREDGSGMTVDLEPDGSPDRGQPIGKFLEETEREVRENAAFEREMGQRGRSVEIPRETHTARL